MEYHALWISHKPATAEARMMERREKAPSKYFVNWLGGQFVNMIRGPTDRDILRDFAYTIPIRRQFKTISGMFVASIDLPKDKALIYSCRRSRIPVAALVHSWDNLPGQGLMSAVPDRLMVWNEMMADQATKLHGISTKQIDIVGGPQYEYYRSVEGFVNEESLRERLSIPKGVHIITYTCTSKNNNFFLDELEFIKRLLKEIMSGSFGLSVLVLRLHPTESTRKIYPREFEGEEIPIRFDIPDDNFAAENTWSVGHPKTIIDFVELMKYSAVVINHSSTIALDAALFDTPVICINFRLTPAAYLWESPSFSYRSSHYRWVAKSGAIDMPENIDALYEAIYNSINYPTERSRERYNLSCSLTPRLPTSKLILESIDATIN